MNHAVRPTAAVCYVTGACNARCVTCAVWRSSAGPDEPSQRWAEAFEQLRGAGVRYIYFSGGEPLLRRDLAELIRAARDTGINEVEMATNGLLLTAGRLDELMDAGLSGLDLSIDGLNETHDRVRGLPGSFEAVCRALVLARKRELPVSVNTNLLGENLHQVPDVLALAREHGATWNPNILNNTQRSFRGVDVPGFLPKDRISIQVFMRTLADGLSVPGTRSALHPGLLPYLADMLAGGAVPDFPCLLGEWLIYVYADMSVSPGCSVMKPPGSLREEVLDRILVGVPYQRTVERMAARMCPGCTCCIWHNLDRMETKARSEDIPEWKYG